MNSIDGTHERSAERDWTHVALMVALFGVGALGVPSEGITQNTFKWVLVALGAGAAIVGATMRGENLAASALKPSVGGIWVLSLFSVLSILWSHSYMGLQASVAWATMGMVALYFARTMARDVTDSALAALWFGAVVASLTGVVQYITGWSWIEQAVAPASSFANRNLAAEYLVCSLPFGVYLAMKGSTGPHRWLWSMSLGVVTAFVVMTGSRAAYTALLAMGICGALFLRDQLRNLWAQRSGFLIVAFGTAATFLLIPSFAPGMEYSGMTGIERAVNRLAQTGAEFRSSYGSIALRGQMWKATLAMFLESPVLGVGAGAWEIEIPRYLVMPTLLEPDYYAHNEPLQMLAEYGLAGAIALIFAIYGGIKHLARVGPGALSPERPIQAVALCGLIGLSVTACAGFPLHQAGTMAALGIFLGLQSRHQSPLGTGYVRRPQEVDMRAKAATVVAVALICTVYYMVQARVEAVLIETVASARLYGLTGAKKAELQEVRDAATHQLQDAAFYEHERRVYLPAVATAVAKAGDMETAVYLWQGVLKERPNLVALKCVLLKANAAIGDMARAMEIYSDPTAKPCQREFDAIQAVANTVENSKSEPQNSERE